MSRRFSGMAVGVALSVGAVSACANNVDAGEVAAWTDPELFADPARYEAGELPELAKSELITSVGTVAIRGWMGYLSPGEVLPILEAHEDDDPETTTVLTLTPVTLERKHLPPSYVLRDSEVSTGVKVANTYLDVLADIPYLPYSVFGDDNPTLVSHNFLDPESDIYLSAAPFIERYEVEIDSVTTTENELSFLGNVGFEKQTIKDLPDIVLPAQGSPIKICDNVDSQIVPDSDYDEAYEKSYCQEVLAFSPWIDEQNLQVNLKQPFPGEGADKVFPPYSRYVLEASSIIIDMTKEPSPTAPDAAVNGVLCHELAHDVYERNLEAMVDFEAAYVELLKASNIDKGIDYKEIERRVALSALWQIFKDSSYLFTGATDPGHPWDKPSELFASGTRILRYHPDQFVGNLMILNPKERVLAGNVVYRLFESYQKIRPDVDIRVMFPGYDRVISAIKQAS